jgi:hypothetical protein
MDHIIEGIVQDGANIDFTKEKLAVHAFVKGQEVAKGEVDTLGHFKVTFASDEERPLTELRVTPVEPVEGAPIVAASEKLEPAQFSILDNIATAQKDFTISHDFLEAIRLCRRRYHMHGTVFAQTTYTTEPAPGLKMDFYEFNSRILHLPFQKSVFGSVDMREAISIPKSKFDFPLFLGKENHLGTAFTDPSGNYDFNFFWLSFLFNRTDPQPDIVVHIAQFNGWAWTEIFCGPVDWNILPDFHRDFVVPATNLRPGPCTWPATGFAFTSIGLLPVDSNHLINGHAFTDANDPQLIANMQNSPFAETLRIGGLFAKAPAIAKYKVQIAETDVNHVPGVGTALVWNDVLDSLDNLQWNPDTRVWDHKHLGPDAVTHLFTNIDNQPNFFEPTLKFKFNSFNVKDGFYAFRIIGLDAAGNQVGNPVELPVLCIDNTRPQAELNAPKAGKCGTVKLDQQMDTNGNPIHTLDLKVTAYDDAGHLLDFGISAERGSRPFEGNVLTNISPSIFMPKSGPGIYDQTETVTIKELPPAFADCPTLVYRVYLGVQGSGTNGYSSRLGSQYTSRIINLTVAKP